MRLGYGGPQASLESGSEKERVSDMHSTFPTDNTEFDSVCQRLWSEGRINTREWGPLVPAQDDLIARVLNLNMVPRSPTSLVACAP